MSHLGYFEKAKLLKGELIIASLDGWIGELMGKGEKSQHNGVLVLTDQRVAFVRKGLFGEVFEAIPLSKVTSVETRSFMGHRVATLHTSHDELSFKTFASKTDFSAVVEAIESRLAGDSQSQPPSMLSSGVVGELAALAALRQSGSLSDEEYKLAKGYLLQNGSLHVKTAIGTPEPVLEGRTPLVGRQSDLLGDTKKRPPRHTFWKVAAGVAAIWFVWNALSGDDTQSKMTTDHDASSGASSVAAAAPTAPSVATSACGTGNVGSSEVVAVTSSYDPRLSPSESGNRIKNEKASAILGELHFHTIDSSTTVRQVCVSGDWSEVEIVTPEWLTDVKGWVPNHVLRGIEKTASGRRIYVEADFYWDEDTSPYKPHIVEAVNKIAREHEGCEELDPFSMSLSGSKSTPNDPVFYVTCTPSGLPFNVWFRP